MTRLVAVVIIFTLVTAAGIMMYRLFTEEPEE